MKYYVTIEARPGQQAITSFEIEEGSRTITFKRDGFTVGEQENPIMGRAGGTARVTSGGVPGSGYIHHKANKGPGASGSGNN